MSDLSKAGAASVEPTKLSTSVDVEDTWDDTESEASEQQSRKVKIYHTLLDLILPLRMTTILPSAKDVCFYQGCTN